MIQSLSESRAIPLPTFSMISLDIENELTGYAIVTKLEAAGVARSVAKKINGHITDPVFERYAIPDQVAFAEII